MGEKNAYVGGAHASRMTRRQFVGAAAFAAGGTALLAGLAGCAPGGAMPHGEVDDTAHEGHAAGEGSGAPAVYLTHAIDP